MPLVLGGSSAAAAAHTVDNSCRFNDDDSASLYRTISSAGSLTTWTFSAWVKRGTLGSTNKVLIDNRNTAQSKISKVLFNMTNEALQLYDDNAVDTAINNVTRSYYRDPSAWYHVVQVWDSTNGVGADRARMWVNGSRITVFSGEVTPDSSQESILLGDNAPAIIAVGKTPVADDSYFDGYMAEVVLIDGTAYDAESFGEFDSDSPTIWKPKDPSGLTFGTNGFYLNFGNSADLGEDSSGNGNDLTVGNLAAIDQCVDTPTNNFCVMNSVQNTPDAAAVYSQGNTVVVTDGSSGDWGFAGTMAMSTGKWYYEHRIYEAKDFVIGIHSNPDYLAFTSSEDVASKWAYAVRADGRMYEYDDAGSQTINTGWGSTFTTGAIISVYLDLDNNKIYWANDDVMMNSGTGIDVTDVSIVQHGVYYWCQTDNNSGESWTITPAFGGVAGYGTTAMSSPVADAEGYGKFEYDPSRGGASDFDGSAKNFLSLCTKNLGSSGG